MKIILDNFLNFSNDMKELQINSKLNQIMMIEGEIKKIVDSVHNTKQFMSKLEKVEQVSLNEDQYVSHELSQKIIKLRLRAKAQTEDMNQLLDVYRGVIELINAKFVRKV
jgi:type I restriction-modification system DNA methylase subunit